MNKYLFYLLFIVISPILFSSACKTQYQKRIGDPAPIRVGIINNPRFDSLNDEQINKVLKEINRGVKERFDVSLNFISVKKENIKDYFDRHIKKISKQTQKRIDEHMFRVFDYDKNDLTKFNKFKKKMAGGLTNALHNNINIINLAIENQGFKTKDFGVTFKDKIEYVIDFHIKKLNRLANTKMKDGMNIIKKNNRFNEFMFWDGIIENQSDYDIIITNQIIISAESYFPTVHSSLRGGITTGVSSKSKTPLHGASLISTFPFISDISFILEDRGEKYSEDELIKFIAWLGIHELGHLLTFRTHYFDHPGCVMRPPPGLRYKSWYEEIKRNGKCSLKHSVKSQKILKKYFIGE